MDGDMVRSYFRWRRRVEGAEELEGITGEGVPAEIQTGGNLESALTYRNYSSGAKYGEEVLTKTNVQWKQGSGKLLWR